MNLATMRAHFGSISVRHYVYLLVTVILALTAFLIGYLYWQNRAFAEVEDIASHYHLETVLYATQIKEEVQHMLARHAEDEARGRASTEHAWSEDRYARHLYVIKKDLIEIAGLHDRFRHTSLNQERYTPVLHKAQRQLGGIDKVWREAGITSGSGFPAGAAQELQLFAYSIEQLRRLHVTAREELQTQQSVERVQAVRNVVVVLVIVLALGSLIVWKILSQISRLIARREQSEVGLRAEITQRTLARAKLRESEQRLRTLASLSPVGICRSDVTGACVYVNERCPELFGLPGPECLGHGWIEALHEEDRDRVRERWAAAVAEGQRFQEECRSKRADARLAWVMLQATPEIDEDGNAVGFIGTVTDITELKLAEQKLRQSATVFESTKDGVLISDTDARIVAVNKAFTEITGYTREEALGKNPRMLMSGWQDEQFYNAMWGALTTTGYWQGEVWDRRKNGEIYPEWLTITAVQDGAGHVMNYVGVFSDITRIKQSEERLEHLAHYDPLTELPNRLLLHSRLAHALERAQRHGERLAVLFLDLDRFKNVNDSLGHPAGDEILQALAQRLSRRLRTEDTLARLGGDEFIILLEQLAQSQDAVTVAQDVLDALSEPFLLAGFQEVYMGSSIGISLYPDDGLDATQLVRNADAAMYQAKEQGRNTYQFYTEALTRAANQRLAMETDMRRALEREEFVVYYQPQVCVASGRMVGAEALVRWLHPDEGLITPARFIPVAEETGLIAPLSEWVLRAACVQVRAWQAAGLPPFTLAVNLSTRQFLRRDLAQRIKGVLEETGLEPNCLQLEITESAIMEQGDHVTAILQVLKSLGITLAMDDFGTGYSSLAYLKRFDIDKLKIDRSFVRDVTDDPSDAAMAASIIAMARNLKLQVVAEGVETDAQLAFLEAHGCHEYQGYLYSRPVPADEFVRLPGLKDQRVRTG